MARRVASLDQSRLLVSHLTMLKDQSLIGLVGDTKVYQQIGQVRVPIKEFAYRTVDFLLKMSGSHWPTHDISVNITRDIAVLNTAARTLMCYRCLHLPKQHA